jgi:hypothetical protein
MTKKIKILTGETAVEAELNESKTAQKIWEALPIEGRNNLWGEEIYFSIPVKAGLEQDARDVVSAGDLGFWPLGAPSASSLAVRLRVGETRCVRPAPSMSSDGSWEIPRRSGRPRTGLRSPSKRHNLAQISFRFFFSSVALQGGAPGENTPQGLPHFFVFDFFQKTLHAL